MRIIHKQFEGGGIPYLEPDCELLCVNVEQGFTVSETGKLESDEFEEEDGGDWD